MPQVSHSAVWKMLRKCAPGHTRELKTHYYWIGYKDKTYRSFPKGAHGSKDPDVELGHVRKMARHLEILDCAKKYLPQL